MTNIRKRFSNIQETEKNIFTNDNKEPVDFLLESGLIGIDAGTFNFNHIAMMSAKSKTDRELLVRILSKVEKRDANELLKESIELDKYYLRESIDNSIKVVR